MSVIPVDDLNAIGAHDLWKSYHVGTPILRGLSVEIPKGKITVIVGKSGVGKSVLLRQIIGLEQPDQGYIEVHGKRLDQLEGRELWQQRSTMGMLFQGSALFDSLSISENVAFYLRQHDDPHTNAPVVESELNDRVAKALDDVGLSGYQEKMPSELSGGQKRRAALARLIIYRPSIMLCDEPTTGLDPVTAAHISELIATTHKTLGATTIMVTHDMPSALAIGDVFALHDDGKIACVADKQSFLSSDNPLIREFLAHATIHTRTTA